MKNKYAGLLVIGVSLLMGAIVWIFNRGMKKIVVNSCSHGSSCSMYGTIEIQTWVSLVIAGTIFIIGLVILNTKPKEKIIIKTKKPRKKKIDKSKLEEKEKKVVEILEKENGALFQKSIMEKLEIGKVGITRLLDKLESKQIIERKRRGMNNIVVLKRNS
ncbi:MAG TPA: hypothetical protein VJ912_03425 [Candidatus Nanoarchaeia archaeon]|nr:hypothetical protein [Candidatus Nanoarchaeia archaeon]